MNDHNLDDLIIANLEPKNSKTKSFLTIIGLLIVVLIVAIILTKIILKNPKEDRLALEDNTELISSELTLKDLTKTPVPAPVVSIKKPTATLPTAVAVPKPIVVPKKVTPVVKPVVPKVEAIKQPIVKTTKTLSQEPKVEKTKKQPVPKPVSAPTQATASQQEYYIQVGSFTKAPSASFLSVIANSGFNYSITAADIKGTKKLLLGPYSDKKTATDALIRVKDRINKSAFVIKQ